MIGRYSEEKRQDVLIEAVKRSAHSHRIQLILAGQGPKEHSLRWQGRSLRYPPIMGFFDTERLCELMAILQHWAQTCAPLSALPQLDAFPWLLRFYQCE